MKRKIKFLLLVILLISIGIAGRLLRNFFLPGENVEPLTAVILLGGAFLPGGYALIVPLATVAVSDAVIGMGYNWIILFTWSAWLIIGLGSWLLHRSRKDRWSFPVKFTALGLGASTFFFVYTNFGVWLEGWLYPRTWSGLIQCFINALPFWRNNLLGNLVILPIVGLSATLIYKFIYARKKVYQFQEVKQKILK